MNKKIFSLFVSIFILSVRLLGQDTVSFLCETPHAAFSVHIKISATSGKTFLVDWGDAIQDAWTGEGTDFEQAVNASHTYNHRGFYTVTIVGATVDCIFTALDVSKTYIHSLDVSKATALIYLFCHSNQLTNLDIRANTQLEVLHCHYNHLTSLDVKANTALEYLNCRNNQLTSLDISNNPALTTLSCFNNQLGNLNVSNNTALNYLDCSNNLLTVLNINHPVSLVGLSCSANQLTNLDVKNHTLLEYLDCANNQLTSLDVSHNTRLKSLSCFMNQLTNLDLSHNKLLTKLSCNSNQLTTLNIDSNTALEELSCSNNQLTSLDISNHAELKNLYCENNAISLINLYLISQRNIYAVLGTQTLPATNVILNTPVAVDTVFNGIYTDFMVIEIDRVVSQNTDYELHNGIFTFLTKGIYTVEITNPAINSYLYPAKIIATYFVYSVGIEDVTKDKILIYPNAVKDYFMIKHATGKRMTIYGTVGEKVLEKDIADENESIAVTSLPSGLYIVRISEKNRLVKTIKMIKE